MKLNVLGLFAAVAACPLPAFSAAAPPELPAAIYADPALDAAHPASGEGVQFESHGAVVNAQLYRPAGEGAHPTVILLHGLPGNEQNLDLARVMQRAGWTVVTFHYRGSWGSGGSFTLKGGVEDAAALLAHLSDRAAAGAWGVDRRRIVIVGHSYGGNVATQVAARIPDLLGVVLIAPWDISFDSRALLKMTREQRQAAAPGLLSDVAGRLGPVTPQSLVEEVAQQGAAMDLSAFATELSGRRLLIVTATRDDDGDKAIGLLEGLKQARGVSLTSRLLDTDHGFNDQRIALEAEVLRWLADLPGGPGSK